MGRQRLLTFIGLVAAGAFAASTVSAQDNRPGYTDYGNASPDAIESSDLIEALSPPRGYSFRKMPPLSVASPIFFEFGKAELTPASEKFVREKLAAALSSTELATFEFSIEGHTDNVGGATANQELSLRRAETVRKLLASNGVPASRLKVAGRGQGSPREANDTEDGRRRNRRVEVVNQGTPDS